MNNVSLIDIPTMISPFDLMKEMEITNSETFRIPFEKRMTYSVDESSACNEKEFNQYTWSWYSFFELNSTLQKYASYKLQNNPCHGDNVSPCCNHFTNILLQDFKTTLNIMRYSQDMSKAIETWESQLSHLGPFECLNATVKDPEKVWGYGIDILNPEVLVPTCDVLEDNKHKAKINCDEFEPILTSRGVCHSFNGKSNKEIYKVNFHIAHIHEINKCELPNKKYATLISRTRIISKNSMMYLKLLQIHPFLIPLELVQDMHQHFYWIWGQNRMKNLVE